MKFLDKLNFSLILPALTIYILGITILLSIAPNLFSIQLIYGLIAVIIFIIFSRIDYHIYFSLANISYIISIFLLLLTLLVGQVTRGSIRWIDLGLFRFQPSEVIKPLLVIFVASWFCKAELSIKKYVFLSLLFFIPTFIVLRQPDLGSSLVYVSFWLIILFASNYKPFLFPLMTLGGIFIIPFFWHFLKEYQKDRIISFLSPGVDPLGIGYNAIQALVAVGSGQIFGRGLGRGTQSHLLFLPEYHTDFIFASFAEEFGFLGVSLLIFFYFLLLFSLIKIAKNAPDKFGQLLAIGVFSVILTQTFVNIGMNMGLLPITGITLPLVSYGGSSLLSMAVFLGIVNNISRVKKNPEYLTIR